MRIFPSSSGDFTETLSALAGEVEKNIINGVWRRPTLGYEGIFQFTFTDENTFTGFYKSGLDKGVMRGKWNGTKITDSSKLISETPNEDSERIQDEIKDAEGNIYFGDFKDGKLHGKGTMIDTDGDRFEGDWIKQLNTLEQDKLFNSIKRLRSERYKEARTFKRHGEGWLNRLEKLKFID